MIRYLEDNPTAFDPDTISILSAALDDAWLVVEANKSAFKVDDHLESARAILAQRIVSLAQQGERDPQRLVASALSRLMFFAVSIGGPAALSPGETAT